MITWRELKERGHTYSRPKLSTVHQAKRDGVTVLRIMVEKEIESMSEDEFAVIEFLIEAERIRRDSVLRRAHKEHMEIYMRGYHAAMRSRKNAQYDVP